MSGDSYNLELHELEIAAGLEKYARNLRRLFWATILSAIFIVVFGFALVLERMGMVHKNSLITYAPLIGLGAAALVYIWTKYNCLDFQIPLRFKHWLTAACLMDFVAFMGRMGGRNIGFRVEGQLIAAIAGWLGLMLFLIFLVRLAQLTNSAALIRTGLFAIFGFATSSCALVILLGAQWLQVQLEVVTLGLLGLTWMTALAISYLAYMYLLFGLTRTLNQLASTVRLQAWGSEGDDS